MREIEDRRKPARRRRPDSRRVRNDYRVCKTPTGYLWQIHADMRQDLLAGGLISEDQNSEFLSLIRNRDLEGLEEVRNRAVSLSTTVVNAASLRLLSSFQRRVESSDPSLAKIALDGFLKSEEICKRNNAKILANWETLMKSRLILEGRKFLKRVLGTAPDITGVKGSHGPGATVSIPRRLASPYEKYGEIPASVGPGAVGLIKRYIRSNAQWKRMVYYSYARKTGNSVLSSPGADGVPFYHFESDIEDSMWEGYLKITPFNRVAFVPKSYKTFRTIAIEPTMNVFLQLGVGEVMTNRLRKSIKVDLTDQSKNQNMAKHGSSKGTYATLDLSAASDRISYELVRLLLPEDWFKLLDSLRSTGYQLDKDSPIVRYEKFSSMGNGATFPLESAVFTTCVYLALKRRGWSRLLRDTAIYGDDIVVPVQVASDVSELLEYFGFSVSPDKSYTKGPFRESCGGDFYRGVKITPIYPRSNPIHVTDIYLMYNQLMTWGYDHAGDPYLFKRAMARLLRYLKPHQRLYGPPCEDMAGYMFGNDFRKRYRNWSMQTRYVSRKVITSYRKIRCGDGTFRKECTLPVEVGVRESLTGLLLLSHENYGALTSSYHLLPFSEWLRSENSGGSQILLTRGRTRHQTGWRYYRPRDSLDYNAMLS